MLCAAACSTEGGFFKVTRNYELTAETSFDSTHKRGVFAYAVAGRRKFLHFHTAFFIKAIQLIRDSVDNPERKIAGGEIHITELRH